MIASRSIIALETVSRDGSISAWIRTGESVHKRLRASRAHTNGNAARRHKLELIEINGVTLIGIGPEIPAGPEE